MSLKNVLGVLFVVVAVSCASTPPVVTPTPSPTPSVSPSVPVDSQLVDNKSGLDSSEFQAAKKAIADAEAADAARYSPNLLAKAKSEYEQAKTVTDKTKARELLGLAENDAKSALKESLDSQKNALNARLDRARSLLIDLQADQYAQADFEKADAQRAAAVAALEKDLTTGKPLAEEALRSLVTLYESLSSKLSKIQRLQKSALAALDDAEKAEAYIWVPDVLQSANDAYFKGTTLWKKRDLAGAEESWSQAEFQAQSAVAKAKKEKDRKKTEDLMIETMKKIEKASKTPTLDSQDNVVTPQPWDGKKELDTIKVVPAPTPSATPTPNDLHSQVIPLPHGSNVVVLGEKSRVSYLDDAKKAWENGVVAMKKEDYTLANQYFLQAQKLVDTYLSLAVDKVYTVRLIPERRDSLWRIAEYENIYNDPFAWPRIWNRNKKLIQNPDLIYPGWQLIIPPQ